MRNDIKHCGSVQSSAYSQRNNEIYLLNITMRIFNGEIPRALAYFNKMGVVCEEYIEVKIN
jgi:hypothetical protein